jgi:hypothetical protein
MKSIKEILEKELGRLSQASVDFAVEQLKRNKQQAGKTAEIALTPEELDELSTSIDFYNRRVRGAVR